VTKKEIYKVVFIMSTFAMVYRSNTSKFLRDLYPILPVPT